MPLLSSSFGGSARGFGRGFGSVAAAAGLPGYELISAASFVGNNGCLAIDNVDSTTVNIYKYQCGFNWDSHVYLPTGYTAPVTCEFNKLADAGDNGASYAMISWNADPGSNASYDTLDWAIYAYSTNNYQVYHNGTNFVNGGTWNSSLKWYLVYGTDGFIYHYNGSNLIYSVSTGSGRTVYLDTSFYSVNSTYSRFSNLKVRKARWNGAAYVA
jgi:hypothetical protein